MALNLDAALRLAVNISGQNKIVAFGRSLEGLQGKVKNTAASLISLNGVLSALGAGAVIAKVFGDTATLQSQIRSLEVLTGSAKKAAAIVQQLRAFAGVTPFESVELIEVAKRLNAFGVQADQVVATTQRLGDVAGATGAPLAELATAYGQVIAKGRLQSEELLQFQERGVALSDELRKIYGRDEFTKALESGRISADAVTVALQRLTDQGGKYAGGAIAQSDTLNGKLSTLLDGVTSLSQTIGALLEPAFKTLLDVGIAALGGIDKLIRGVVQGLQDAYRESALFRSALAGLIGALGTLATIQVFSAFIAGARAAITIIGTLIQALKGLTAANLVAAAAGLLKGKPALIAALAAGIGVGVDALFNKGRIVKAVSGGISGALDQVFAGFGATLPKVLTPQLQGGGPTPDLSGVKTTKAPKEIKEITGEQLKLSFLLNKAKLEDNKLKQAELEYALTLLDLDSQTLGVRQRQKLEADAAVTLFQAQVDYAKEVGTAVAQDFLKRQELQENYKKTVEDLQIKAGLITGEQLKQLEIDRELAAILERLPGLTDAQIAKLRELIAASQDVKKSFKDAFSDSLKEYYKELTNLGSQVAEAVKGAFKGLEDQLVNFVTTGKLSFKDLANSIIADIARIAIRQAIIAPLLKGIGKIFNIKLGESAKGNVFAQNGIQKFARGGIVDRPTVFPFAKGIGLMGEAGPEAIMPLRRGPDGRLGVSGGGGTTNVVVNVDASGSSVQGDQQQARQLGAVVSAAVQAELVKQKRPGGLLA